VAVRRLRAETFARLPLSERPGSNRGQAVRVPALRVASLARDVETIALQSQIESVVKSVGEFMAKPGETGGTSRKRSRAVFTLIFRSLRCDLRRLSPIRLGELGNCCSIHLS